MSRQQLFMMSNIFQAAVYDQLISSHGNTYPTFWRSKPTSRVVGSDVLGLISVRSDVRTSASSVQMSKRNIREGPSKIFYQTLNSIGRMPATDCTNMADRHICGRPQRMRFFRYQMVFSLLNDFSKSVDIGTH